MSLIKNTALAAVTLVSLLCSGASAQADAFQYDGVFTLCTGTCNSFAALDLSSTATGTVDIDVGSSDVFAFADVDPNSFSFLITSADAPLEPWDGTNPATANPLPVNASVADIKESGGPMGAVLTTGGTTDATGDLDSGTLLFEFTVPPFSSNAAWVIFDLSTGQGRVCLFFNSAGCIPMATESVNIEGDFVRLAPEINVTPTSLNFGDVNIGATSVTQDVTINNTGNADLSILGEGLSGTNPGDFAFTSTRASRGGSCGSIPPDGSCTLSVSFTPGGVGPRSATLVIESDDTDNSPFEVDLNGNGLGPQIAVSPTSLSFGSVVVGDMPTLSVSVTNTGGATLNVTSAAADNAFAVTNNTCAMNPLANGDACIIDVEYVPGAPGTDTGTLTIDSDATNAVQVLVPLSGSATATPVPLIAWTNASVNFGSVLVGATGAADTITISNEGTATFMTFNVTQTGDTGEFQVTQGCTVPLAPNESCDVVVAFSPTSLGTKALTINFATDDTVTPSLDLIYQGTGVQQDIDAAPTTLAFGDVQQTLSSDLTVTITNEGMFDLGVTGVSVGGTDPADFSAALAGACATLAPAASCELTVTFAPLSLGAKSATVDIASDDPDENPFTITVSGTGLAAPEPIVGTDVMSLAFGSVEVMMTSALTVTVDNSGDADLDITALDLTGTDAAEFSTAGTCLAGPVAPAGTCTVDVTFAPLTEGAKSATLTIANIDADVEIALTGTGTPIPVATIGITPSSLDFMTVDVGSTSGTQSVTVSSDGNIDLTLGGASLGGADADQFTLTDNCPASLMPAQTCTLDVVFAPTSDGAKTADLTIPSNDVDSGPQTVTLTGTAAPLVPAISADTMALDFGQQTVGDSDELTVTITNTGTADLDVGQAASIDALEAPFALGADSCSNTTVAPMGTCTITVTSTPLAAGTFPDSFGIVSNAPSLTISVTTVVVSAPAPDIDAMPTGLDFGQVIIGDTATLTVNVRNLGDADLNITGVTGGGSFAVTSDCTTLAPMGSCTITVVYTPTIEGAETANLTIDSNDEGEAMLVLGLTGSGAPVPAPELATDVDGVTFPGTLLGFSADAQNVVISNAGSVDLMISGITISGADAAAFAVTSDCMTLTPSASCTATVTFTPEAPGDATASLDIASNDPDAGTTSVPLSGSSSFDDDGIDDAVEAGAPNGGDGNNDGTPDSEQANVTSLPGLDTAYVTIASPAGTVLRNVQINQNPAPSETPEGFELSPSGFIGFTLDGLAVGASVTVEVTLPAGTAPDTYFKYGPEPTDMTDHFYEFGDDGTTGASIAGDVVTLSLVDGARGDGDGQADGSITDPGVPAVAVVLPPPMNPPVTVADAFSEGQRDCFIATAAYGSYLEPEVVTLRTFRDRWLITNGPGRWFVSTYYTLSPPVAAYIAERPVLRGATRLTLTPVVWSVKYPLLSLMTVVLLAAGLRRLRARRRALKPA